MGLTHQNILGIRITTSSKEKILEEIKKWLNHPKEIRQKNGKTVHAPRVIVTPNPEQIVLAQKNSWFKELLNRADVTLPDGIGLVLASRYIHGSWFRAHPDEIQKRIHGVDFMGDLVRLSSEQRVRIGLIGGLPGLAVNALECLREIYPRLEGWVDEGPELIIGKNGDIEGPGEDYWIAFAKRIISTKTQVIFVGLGAPKQEYVIHRLSRALSSIGDSSEISRTKNDTGIILMAVGGSFDLIAGRLKRAPLFIRSIGFEWVWRLVQEPWRWKRQLALIQFLILVVKTRGGK